MASAIKCDRCGYSNIKLSDFMHIRTHTFSDATTFNTSTIEHFDLCQKCYDEVFDFKKSSDEEEA